MTSAPPQDRHAQDRPLEDYQLVRTGPLIPRRIAPETPVRDAQGTADAPAAPSATPAAQPKDQPKDALMPPRTGPIIRPHEMRVDANALPQDALLLEPETVVAPPLHAPRPTAGEMLLHPFKTLYMVVALLVDRRVSILRKLLFVVPIVVLAVGLIVPETLVGILAGIVAPVVGLALDLPIDGAVDWLGVGLLAFALLAVFPTPIVAQYHAQLFHRTRGK